jgi:hypothetical protein
MKNYTIIGVVALVVIVGVVWAMNAQVAKAPGGAQIPSNTQPPGTVKACTQEAKICPDGSAVGRMGPNCEFAACPTAAPAATTTTTTTTTTTSGTVTLTIGKSAAVNGTTIGVLSLSEDSRCPVDVQCIQAGTVRVRASVNALNRDFTFSLGQPQVVGNVSITLSAVIPAQKFSRVTVQPGDYRFTFTVVPK